MDHFDANGFRSNVGIILTREDGTLLLAGRARQSGWQFPQGGIQVDETPLQAMYRELQEEVGLGEADVDILGETAKAGFTIVLPKKFIRRDTEPLCIGQRQRWFMLRLLSDEQQL